MSASPKVDATGLVETAFDVLASVDHHAKPDKQIAVGRGPKGGLAILERDDLGRLIAGHEYELEELLRIAENVLARNPRALTWPPAPSILAAGIVGLIALLERGPLEAKRGAPPA